MELNDLEKLLRALPVNASIEALDLMETLTRKTAQDPKEEKYRKIRWTNEKLAPMTQVVGACEAMVEIMVLHLRLTKTFGESLPRRFLITGESFPSPTHRRYFKRQYACMNSLEVRKLLSRGNARTGEQKR